MYSIGFDLEPAPINSNRYNGSYLLGHESSDYNIGTIGRIVGLNFDVKGGLGINIDFRDEFGVLLLFFVFEKPTEQAHD